MPGLQLIDIARANELTKFSAVVYKVTAIVKLIDCCKQLVVAAAFKFSEVKHSVFSKPGPASSLTCTFIGVAAVGLKQDLAQFEDEQCSTLV